VEALVLISVLALTVAGAAGLAKGVLSLMLHLMVDELHASPPPASASTTAL
jgi:hypothetical protein